MALLNAKPASPDALPTRAPLPQGGLRRAAEAQQNAGVRLEPTRGRLPPGVRIIDGEQLYSAAWLGGKEQ
jgi:hypothetical protein